MQRPVLILATVFAALVIAAVFSDPVRGAITRTIKGSSLSVFASAERAYRNGDTHFGSGGALYDLEQASAYYKQALLLDPEQPYVYHQLARIAFLKGNFDEALSLIERQISMHGDKLPNSYYIRALIEGFSGDYDASARDYERYLSFDPTNWAAINDYAWVLLKAGRAREAVVATAGGLSYFPDNAWLLNTNATALYEMGLIEPARGQISKALVAAAKISEADWLLAYPGNDPKVAAQGVAAFQSATIKNMHSIGRAMTDDTVQ